VGIRERVRGAVWRWLTGPAGQPSRRTYAAAQISRLTSKWFASILSGNKEIEGDIRVLRARARQLFRDNPHARQYGRLLALNTAGPYGITLQSQIANSRRGLNQRANREIELAWHDWGRPRTASIDGRLSFAELLQAVPLGVARDGEVILRHRRDAKHRYGYSLQLIDPDQLDETYNERPPKGNQIIMGVEVDGDGTPVAYHLWRRHPSDVERWNTKNERIRVPAEDIIHLHLGDRPGQVRGIPDLAVAMLLLRTLGEWRQAAVIGAQIGAAKMGFFVDKRDEAGDVQIEPSAADDGSTPNRLSMEVEPGVLGQLPPGWEFQAFDPDYPNIEYEGFERALLRSVASGLGVSYTALTGDLSQNNFASSRVGLLNERDYFTWWQKVLVDRVCEPVYRAWLESAAAQGVIRPPTYDFDLLVRQAVWKPRGWPWVDPVNDVKAIKEKIALGLTTRTAEAAALGGDFEDNLEMLEKEQTLAEEYGVNVSGLDAQEQQMGEEGEDGTQGTGSSADAVADGNGRTGRIGRPGDGRRANPHIAVV